MITAMLLTAFLITPFGLFFLLLLIFRKPSLHRRYVYFIGLMFGMIGYCTKPLRVIDISRYHEQLDAIRNLPVSSAANWMDDGLIIKNIFFWTVAQMHDNQLLQFFSLFIIYSICAYLLSDSLKDSKAELFSRLFVLEILLVPFYNVFSNVRNVTAFALLALAVYRDLYRNKKDFVTLILYIVPCYVHMAGLVIIAIRVLLPVIKRMSYAGMILTFGIPTAAVTYYPRLRNISLPGNIGKILSRAIWKGYASIVRTSEYAQEAQSHGSFIVNRLIATVFCVILFYLIVRYQKIYRGKDRDKYEYSLYISIITIIGFMMSVMGVVKYWVFMYLIYISFIPILIEFVHYKYRKNREYYVTYMINLIALARGLLQARTMLTNLDIFGFMSRILYTDYLMVGFRAIKGLLTVH